MKIAAFLVNSFEKQSPLRHGLKSLLKNCRSEFAANFRAATVRESVGRRVFQPPLKPVPPVAEAQWHRLSACEDFFSQGASAGRY
jgi:hypothetical protein